MCYTFSMDKNEKYQYWLDAAEYDLETAEAMYASSRWLYVAFMCQQAIEKLAKGLYILYLDDNVPRIHNIRQIVNRYSGMLREDVPNQHYSLFDKLASYYIEGRYPEYREKLSTLIARDEAETILIETKEAFS